MQFIKEVIAPWVLGIFLAFCIVIGLGVTLSKSETIYQSPDEEIWYKTLKQPDNPDMGCCGWGDAYYADRTEACTLLDGPDCALVAIVTDTRPDTRTYVRQDGSEIVIVRPHYDVGFRVPIPKHKIRKRAVENVTDHNVVFFKDYGAGLNVYCWEPVGGI